MLESLSICIVNLIKGEKDMVICIVMSGIIALLSIFAFFGNAFSNTGGTAIPNMFQLMFGGSGTYHGYEIQWKQYGGLTFLFVLQILIMIVAIISFFICYNIKFNYEDESHGLVISVIMGLMSIVALIVSFCTLTITDINQNGYYNVELGFGPIFYSILNIIIVVLLIIGIVLNYIQPSYSFRNMTSSYGPSTSSTYTSSTSQNNNPSTKPTLSENEKADLILKYKKMLDDGIITQEEFDQKKKELL